MRAARGYVIDDDAETKKKALDMKAAGFFRKPVDATALLLRYGPEREGETRGTSVDVPRETLL
jgi:hypothetical protein